MNNYVVVKTFNTHIEAEIAKGYLETDNITAVIVSDDEGGTAPFPFQPNSKGVQLFVKKTDREISAQLLQK